FQLSYQQMPLFGMTVPYFGLNDSNINDFLRKKYTYLRLMNVFYYVTTNQYDDKATNYTTPVFSQQKKSTEDGTIYKINNPNSFISSFSHVFLFIGKDTLHDFNALKVKSLVLSKNFDIQKYVIFSTDEDISKLDLSQFSGFIIDDVVSVPDKIKHTNYITLHFSYNHYDYVSQRSNSVFVDNPAVYLAKNEQKKFDTFLQKADLPSNILSQEKNNPTIKLLTFTPEKLIFSVTTANQTAITIADTYFPNWYATIDKNSTSVFMSDGLLKGMFVPKGMHIVTLEFKPVFFYIGALITIISVVTIGIFLYKMYKK
ncbi:MAG TPA: hypothetical protein VF820_04615, partial [Patescibacteria group bacterium]